MLLTQKQLFRTQSALKGWKIVLEVKNPISEKILYALLGCFRWSNTCPKTPETPSDCSGIIRKLLEAFWKNSKFWIFEKKLSCFHTVLAYFWRFACIEGVKNRFFQKVKIKWISKIWPDQSFILTYTSPCYEGLIIEAYPWNKLAFASGPETVFSHQKCSQMLKNRFRGQKSDFRKKFVCTSRRCYMV